MPLPTHAAHPLRRRPWRRPPLLATLAFLVLSLLGLLPATSRPDLANPLAALARGAGSSGVAPADELDERNLPILSLPRDLDPEAALRARPFVVADSAGAAFVPDSIPPRPLTEDAARRRLDRFLAARGADAALRAAALARYDDSAVARVLPAPTLRAALLMLSGWNPYAAIVGAVLDGANPSGRRFAAVDFGRTGVPGAVATLVEDPSGAVAIVVDRRHTSDLPEQLLPVVVHEALHGGGDNSRQEEIIANVLDTVAYAQVLLVAPEVAAAGTQLAVYNNAALLALLNSTGPAGPARLGITASPRGDVWLGPDLDRVDAASLTDAISGDDYYQALPATGSPGPPAFAALLRPFPGGATLGPDPRFDDAALALVDRGVGVVVPPADALRLARTLGLALTDVAALAASSWPRTSSGPRPGYSP